MAFVLAALGIFLFAPARADAQDENARLLGAHILVLKGDLKRLMASDMSAIHKDGLRARIKGMLGSLAWQLRLNDDRTAPPEARGYAENWPHRAEGKALAQWLDALSGRHRLDIAPFDPKYARAQDIAKALALHKAYCAACHDGTGQSAATARPARSLYAMAHDEPLQEFIARMVGGVRGDRMTGLSNPLSNAQIAALIALYKSTKLLQKSR